MRVVFALYDSTGAPLTTATPTFARYVGSDGVPRTAPAISNLGGGLYGFTPVGSDYTVGTAYEINCGAGASPARANGAITVGAFVAFALYDDAGAPLTTATPTFAVYKGYDGSNPTPPTISNLGGGLYGFTPAAGDVALDVAYLITATGANPSSLSGSLDGTLPPVAGSGSTSSSGILQFPYAPAYSAQLDEQPRLRSAQFGDGYSQRSADGINSILQKWSLKFSAQTKTDAEAILGFFRAHGGVTPFEFALPDGNWTVVGESFGTGDGTRTQWQLHRQTVHVSGIESMPGAFEACADFTAGPVVYVAGVPKTAGVDYTLSASGLVAFTVAPANAAALTFDGSGEAVKLVVCQQWSDVLSNAGVFDLTATFQEVMA
jgi:phage-related protein